MGIQQKTQYCCDICATKKVTDSLQPKGWLKFSRLGCGHHDYIDVMICESCMADIEEAKKFTFNIQAKVPK